MKYISCLFLLLPFLLINKANGQPHNSQGFFISGNFKDAQQGDTVTLQVWEHFAPRYHTTLVPSRTFRVPINDGRFSISIPIIDTSFYFNLWSSRNGAEPNKPTSLLYNYFGERGDSIHILADSISPQIVFRSGKPIIFRFNPDTLFFEGHGSAKYQFQFAIANAANKKTREVESKFYSTKQVPVLRDSSYFQEAPNRMLARIGEHDSAITAKLNILRTYENRLSQLAKEVLLADMIGVSDDAIITFFGLTSSIGGAKVSKQFADNMKLKVTEAFRTLPFPSPRLNGISQSSLARSTYFVNSSTTRSGVSVTNGGKAPLEYLLSSYVPGKLRDFIVTNYFLFNGEFLPNAEKSVTETFGLIKDPFAQNVLTNYLKKRSVGKTMYNFVLTDFDGKTVKFEDFQGKIVFMDFWYTGCAGCAQFFKNELSKVETILKKYPDLVFITISIDSDEKTWKESVLGGNYTHTGYPNVVNLFTGGRGKKDPLIESLGVSSYPFPILIDRNGKILQSSNLRTSVSEMVAILENAIKSN